jgi:hypothetical protein
MRVDSLSHYIHSLFPDFTLWIGWNVCFWH